MNSPTTRNRTLLISALGGALAGLGFGFFLIKQSEEKGKLLSFSAGEGLSLAFMLLGFVRQLAQLGDGNDAS